MKRATAGVIVALIGAALLIAGLASSRWLIAMREYFDEDAVPTAWRGWIGPATWGAGLACVLGAPLVIVTRARWLCAAAIAIACVALFGGLWLANDAAGRFVVGPIAIGWMLGAAAMIAAPMLLMSGLDGTIKG